MSESMVIPDEALNAQVSKRPSLFRVAGLLVVIIFLAEIAAMTILYYLDLPNYIATTLLDSFIMVLLILPGLYIFQLRPILKEMEERAKAEISLRNTHHLLRRVLELLPVGVWITDKNGQIVLGNRAGAELWGGLKYVDIGHYEEYKGWWPKSGERIKNEEWAGTRAVTRGETILEEEIEIESFDGVRKIVLNSAVPIIDEQEQIMGAIIVNYDITERRRNEEELIQTNELLEKFFLNIGALIAYLDRDFNFIRVNETYAVAGEHPPEFFIGKNHFDLYPSLENQNIFQQVVDTGEPYLVLEKPFEYPEFPERGLTYWDWALHPVKDAAGEVRGLVLSLVDVTQRKLAEIQLEKQNQELRELSQTEQKHRELAESLAQAALALNKSLELDEVLSTILEQIRKAIPSQGASIFLLKEGLLHLAGASGFESYPDSLRVLEGVRRLKDYPLIEDVNRTLEPILIQEWDDLRRASLPPGLKWVTSYIAVPLLFREQVTGFLILHCERPNAFNQQDVDRLIAFSAHAATAIENAQAYHAELTARRAAESMNAAARALTYKLDLRHVINTLLDYLHQIITSEAVVLILFESGSHPRIEEIRTYGRWKDLGTVPFIPVESITDSIVQRLITFRKSLLIRGREKGVPSIEGVKIDLNGGWLFVPLFTGERVIGLVQLASDGIEEFSLSQIQWVEALVNQAALAIQNAELFEQVSSSGIRLQALARKLVEVQENERNYIARELHDEAGQVLSSLKLNIRKIEQDPGCPPKLRQELSEMKCLTDSVLDDLHRLAMDLRPAALDHLGLVAAVEQLVSRLRSEQLMVGFKAIGFDGVRLSNTLETSLYRIVQEAVTNVLRYAQANNLGILIERSEGRVKVLIEDDGLGFEPDQVKKGAHLGLIGMQERVEMLGGTLTIESSEGMGTTIVVEAPDDNPNFDSR
jgi:PAS domain S-box-containing protein